MHPISRDAVRSCPLTALAGFLCVMVVMMAKGAAAAGDEGRRNRTLADSLRALDTQVLPPARRESAANMVPDDLDRRLRAADQRSTAEWRAIETREQWAQFRAAKLARLRQAIRLRRGVPDRPRLRVSGTVEGDGYRIKNLVFESRPRLWVTANLYVPAEPTDSMPGLLICHSHHTPKEHGELQDMGMTWARAGCLVLVPDMLGHGERRQHPFVTAADYREPYRVGRQDYYFRYDVGMQLHLAGETLMGWFVHDLRCCVSVLLARPGVDPKRIILLGAVAGGGDPAAVAAALDERVAGAVVFNFGGAEPESPCPLPEDAEVSSNYAGSGSFESTRNLARSARDGFLPWTIVGAVAPRPLVYAHEFAWDRPRDPVWKRLQRIWGFYEASDRLAATRGRGSVKGRPPESTHCTHIGRVHRRLLHPILARGFRISATESDEYTGRLEPETLRCMTPDLAEELKPARLCDLLPCIAGRRVAAARGRRARLSQSALREELRRAWSAVLGSVGPPASPSAVERGREQREGVTVLRLLLDSEPGIPLPLVLLVPEAKRGRRAPVVVAVAHAGKDELLRHRAEAIAGLLLGGVAVCLPDLRGLGETEPRGSRELWGAITAQSSTELMLGGTCVGARLRDLRAVLAHLRGRDDVDPTRIALWGDSLAAANPAETDFRIPRHVDDRPKRLEPLGGLLALLGALYEDGVAAVCVLGGLSDFQSVLRHQAVLISHDVAIPGAVETGDLPDLAGALAPRPLRLAGLVDGLNRTLSRSDVARAYGRAIQRYRDAEASDKLVIDAARSPSIQWLLRRLRGN
ncbi:MAG: hypothetical protein ISS72_03960 [Candidatus Brocadiae bacterium]|nr:hypothetical protein [Candidatus Brocadiia bacterium]